MEVITVSESVTVAEVDSLIEIPSEHQVRQAISKLCKKQEKYPDMFSYIKFPFGMIDYEGLSILATNISQVCYQKKNRVAEEKAWLKQLKENCEGLGINIERITQYFQDNVWSTSSVTSIQTLVGKRWLADDVIDVYLNK